MAIDVTEATWETAVIERSRDLPVVVDFWAEWCGPCRTLGPVIEKEVAARGGAVELAKVDVDSNPALQQRYGIQGIPAVKAFRDGEVAAEFVGAQPPAKVAAFLDGLVPSQADSLLEAGDEASLRQALELEPARADVALALALLLRERGEDEEALKVLESFEGDFAAAGLAARIRLSRDASPGLAAALEAVDAGSTAAGVEGLLEELAERRNGDREDLRRAIVGALAALDPGDPQARAYRRRLASLIY
jgi:putative thioredoxin